MPKYTAENLIPALRTFVRARQEALELGFTDNGGAIHSIERIADILCRAICYPHIKHPSKVISDQKVEISVKALVARKASISNVRVEHVMPQRAFARQLCDLIQEGQTDAQIVEHIKSTYRLVILTNEEAKALDKINRSHITPDRVAEAGIVLAKR
nr:hypothetical protein [uncultured Cohaesibacter sp.]